MDGGRPNDDLTYKPFYGARTVLIDDEAPVCLSEYYDTDINLGYVVKCTADAGFGYLNQVGHFLYRDCRGGIWCFGQVGR